MKTTFRTKRLTLRPLTVADAGAVSVLGGEWDIARMTARIPYPYTAAMAQAWIAGIEPGECVRGIELHGRLIGAIGYLPDAEGSAELGYWIGKPWWGQGLATEAAEALVRYCFADAKIARLTCCHFVDNAASARVVGKLGFKRLDACQSWCEARRANVEAVRYERRRPVMAIFWRRAA